MKLKEVLSLDIDTALVAPKTEYVSELESVTNQAKGSVYDAHSPAAKVVRFGDGIKNRKIGWTSCSCNADYRPGIVLDPFAGSGTVALVSKNLQRSSVSIELKPEYIEMMKRRIDFGHETIDNGIIWIES